MTIQDKAWIAFQKRYPEYTDIINTVTHVELQYSENEQIKYQKAHDTWDAF